MSNPSAEAFSEYLSQSDGMLNAMDAFAAGWNAAMDFCMQPSNEKAPGEAATSDQRKRDKSTDIIAAMTEPVNG